MPADDADMDSPENRKRKADEAQKKKELAEQQLQEATKEAEEWAKRAKLDHENPADGGTGHDQQRG